MCEPPCPAKFLSLLSFLPIGLLTVNYDLEEFVNSKGVFFDVLGVVVPEVHSVLEDVIPIQTLLFTHFIELGRLDSPFSREVGPEGLHVPELPRDLNSTINHLIMKLNVGENFMFDQVTGQSSVTITGYVLFDLTPNKGDLFIKDVGDGRAGLFTLVEQPEIYTVTADKCYGIEARMIGFVTQAIIVDFFF
ncbi:hypothetical protein AP1_0463 [Aeromonas phage AP1]|nr:hypothetical protein AP1_0463 [Aeromonas phage AP1]